MNNKIVLAICLTVALSSANSVYAAAQGIHEAGTGVSNPELKAQNQGTGQGLQNESTSTKPQNGTATGTQEQNRVKNQGEDSQIQTNERQNDTNNNSETSQERRSQVANAVQQMLQIADRNGGIGEQVRTIAQTQTQNQEKLETSLQKIQSRSGFTKFFVGPNYGEVNQAEKLLEQNREQIQQLEQIKSQLTNQGDAELLTSQIQTLEQANLQIQNALQNSQKGFSLLGWMFKLFAK